MAQQGSDTVPVPVAGPAGGSSALLVLLQLLVGVFEPLDQVTALKGTAPPITDPRLKRGNTYMTSLPLVSVRHHGHVNSVNVEINFTSGASTVFHVHNLSCDKCI